MHHRLCSQTPSFASLESSTPTSFGRQQPFSQAREEAIIIINIMSWRREPSYQSQRGVSYLDEEWITARRGLARSIAPHAPGGGATSTATPSNQVFQHLDTVLPHSFERTDLSAIGMSDSEVGSLFSRTTTMTRSEQTRWFFATRQKGHEEVSYYDWLPVSIND